ncbi:MAG: TonB-dependent receptor [Bacteroidota bacterium]
MKKSTLLITLLLIIGLSTYGQNKYTYSGYIKDASSGEELIGAAVYVEALKTGTITNSYGFFSISLPKNTYSVKISYIGYETQVFKINLANNIRKDIQMKPQNETIEEVKVVGKREDENVSSNEMSVNKLEMKTILKIPALMGEVDVLRTIQMLPGVQTVGEGSIGFYVRGGGVDQNLILLDEATVYNASHLGGIFSVFNQDALKDVKLYKGGIPSIYGGRLSSILEIRMKEGNKKKFNATGGLGLVSSRLTLEAPIIKDKGSFIVSGRRMYVDLFFPLMKDSLVKKSKAHFYDFNAKANYEINENNRVFVSGYFGKDIVKFGDLMGMDYGNQTLTTRFNHLFNSKVFANYTIIYSKFDYGIGVPNGEEAFDWSAGINDLSFKNDYTWFLNPQNKLEIGGLIMHHTFRPGKFIPTSDESIFSGRELDDSYAMEYGVYAENDQKIGDKLSLRYGLRFSAFQNLGPYTHYIYDDTDPDAYIITDSVKYSKGELFNTNMNLEPRLSINYRLNNESSLKLSYNRMVQYIHLTTNTMTMTPMDIWFPSSPNVKPQKADQFALGYFRNFLDNTYETSVEFYYKEMYNTIDYKDHAEMLLNPYLEGELRFGDSYSYGAEFLLKKQVGEFTGWLSYTYSRVIREIPEINNGNPYPANYDKPNDISLILSYDFFEKLNVSLSWFYSTGAPRTMPTGRFEYSGMIVPVYSDRNSVRLPDYHRMDVAVTYNFSKTKENGEPKKFHSSLNFSIYNLYNRHNAYSITFEQVEGRPFETQAVKTYLFKTIPSITYNFRF